MTNPTPHGQVPEALRLAEEISNLVCSSEATAKTIAAAADELCRLHVKNASLRAQQPAGWKLVPVEPTPEMWKAAKTVPDPNPPYPQHYGLVWDAMLAASPPAEQQATTTGAALGSAPGVAYTNKPDAVAWLAEYGGDVFTYAQLMDFADRTHAARLRCKSEQARLATLWGYVRADAAPKAAPGDAIDEAMRERDDAEDFIDALLDEVLGHERPEWSNLYGRADALNDVQERMTSLHKPAVDKAWGQFESAMAAPQPSPTAQAAESVPAEGREQERTAFKAAHRHLELDEVPDAWGRPMFKHSHVEASWLGWIARAVLDKWGQPAHSGEPVAWLNPWRADKVTTDYDAYGERGIPLYTAPQPAPAPLSDDVPQKTWALLDELEKMRGANRDEEDWDTLNKRDDELRAALAAQGGK